MTQSTTVLPGAEAYAEAAERFNDQVRAFGEQAVATAREAGKQALETYEKTVATYLDYQQKAAEAAPVEALRTVIETHSAFVKEFSDAYVKAVRLALN